MKMARSTKANSSITSVKDKACSYGLMAASTMVNGEVTKCTAVESKQILTVHKFLAFGSTVSKDQPNKIRNEEGIKIVNY